MDGGALPDASAEGFPPVGRSDPRGLFSAGARVSSAIVDHLRFSLDTTPQQVTPYSSPASRHADVCIAVLPGCNGPLWARSSPVADDDFQESPF